MAQVLQLPIIKGKGRYGGDRVQELFPVPLRLFQPAQALPCTVYFKSPAQKEARKGDVLSEPGSRPAGSPPGDEDVWGYFDPAEAGLLVDYLCARLAETNTTGDGSSLMAKVYFVYDTAVVWIQHFFHGGPDTFTPRQVHLAANLIDRLYRLIKEAGLREAIVAVRRHDSGLFTHSVNVCLLGLAFVQHLGWPRDEAEIFGLGALLHDVGMASLPRGTWIKTTPLTAEEQEAIRTHPLRGVQLLEKIPELPGTIFHMVAQHHESDDGSGYPWGLPEGATHPWARLLRLLDTYEAMTSIRPWRAPLSSGKALKVLRHGTGQYSLATVLLTSFEEFLGS